MQQARIGVCARKFNLVSEVFFPDSSCFPLCRCLIALAMYSRRNEVHDTYGLPLPNYSHPPCGVEKWVYMSDYAFLPRQDEVPHMACILSDTNRIEPSQSEITLGEMDAILALLAHAFACKTCSEHAIKPVSFHLEHDYQDSLIKQRGLNYNNAYHFAF